MKLFISIANTWQKQFHLQVESFKQASSKNVIFIFAAYAGYEDNYWASELHKAIRDSIIESIDKSTTSTF